MIRGKFLAQDDFDLAGQRFLNWQWIADIPTREGEEGQTIAIVDGVAKWATLSADGLVVVEWADILNKPTVFPPEDHTHPWDEVTGKPTFVNSLSAGLGLQVDSSTGNVIVALSDNMVQATRFYVGAVLESLTVDVTSDGADISLTVTSASGSPVLVFQDSRPIFDTTGSPSIVLTAGTDAAPVMNYVWIPSDTQVLTTGSAWPTGIDYVPIATVYCQSAASAQTYGLYKVHVWTDHTFTDNQTGHLAHLNSWIRTQPATWRSGAGITPTLGAGQFDIALTSGVVLQLHDHAFPAMTTIASSEPLYVVNDYATAFKRVANMSAELTDSANGSLTNRYYSIVVWGIVSEDAEDCKMMVNLPAGSYNTAVGAQADTTGYADYGIPVEFAGTGFLIARLVVRHQSAGSTFTLVESIDLRGTFPGGFAGGSAGSGDHGALIGLSDPDHPLTALQAGAATAGMGITLVGTTWTATNLAPGDVDLGNVTNNLQLRNEANGLTSHLGLGTPASDSLILIELFAGNLKYATVASLPISTATQTALDLKEDTLAAYDAVPTNASTNIVESNGVFDALATKEDTLAAYDVVPTNASTNICESNGIFDALATKEDSLAAYDAVPTDASTNICESNGIFDALAGKMDVNGVTTVTTGAYTLAAKRFVICTAAGAITLTLPAASGKTGIIYTIKRSGAGGNGVTINAGGGDTIDGSATIYLFTQYTMWEIVSDGSNWHKIGII